MKKYAPLYDHLRAADTPTCTLSFQQVEQLLEERLPASARQHRAWWANEAEGSHVQAAAWMDAGWRVAEVDLETGSVRFQRA